MSHTEWYRFVQNIKYLMILHLTSSNVICLNQQSDLLMYSSGLFQRHIVSHIKMGTSPPPPMTSTQLNIPKSVCFSQRFILCSKDGAFAPIWSIFFTCLGELMLFVLLRSILSEPGDEKTCLRGFWSVKIQSGLLSYRC